MTGTEVVIKGNRALIPVTITGLSQPAAVEFFSGNQLMETVLGAVTVDQVGTS